MQTVLPHKHTTVKRNTTVAVTVNGGLGIMDSIVPVCYSEAVQRTGVTVKDAGSTVKDTNATVIYSEGYRYYSEVQC